MKKLFFLAALCLAAVAGRAQTGTDMPMATLQSGDNVSVYYGKNALVDAYNAAADSGDVVTLSAGVFTAPREIQKSLSIIGNGYVNNQENGKFPTQIEGSLTFKPRDIIDDDGETVAEAIGYDGTRLEGFELSARNNNYIYLEGTRTVKNFSIVKCNMWSFNAETNTENLTIRQSRIDYISLNDYKHLNSYIVGSWMQQIGTPIDGMMTIDHCIISDGTLKAGTISNSILKYTESGVTANNCIFLEYEPANIQGTGNWVNCKYAGIFEKELTNLDWNWEENHFALKYPSEYVGTDGTQVGLYGGPYPYNPTPTTPQIKESDIDSTVADGGTLKVSVTVEAQTEN